MSILDFLALQHAAEAAMRQAYAEIEWVTEGGANQVCLLLSAIDTSGDTRIKLYLITL